MLFFANLQQIFILELWPYKDNWTANHNESRKCIGEKLSTNAPTPKSKVLKMFYLCEIISKNAIQVESNVVQVELSSKRYYETLTLVSRYFKPIVFPKKPHLTHFAAEMIMVLGQQQKIKDTLLGETNLHFGKTIGRWLGFKLKNFLKTKRCEEIVRRKYGYKHPSKIEFCYHLLDGAPTAQWQLHKDIFTLANC